jgi:hypothetical protein
MLLVIEKKKKTSQTYPFFLELPQSSLAWAKKERKKKGGGTQLSPQG